MMMMMVLVLVLVVFIFYKANKDRQKRAIELRGLFPLPCFLVFVLRYTKS